LKPVYKILTITLVFLLLSAIPASLSIATESDEEDVYTTLVGDYPITSDAAVVIDFLTGTVIYEFNADELRVPASMAKMAAVYVVFDAIRDGVVSFDTLIETTASTARFSRNRGFSNVPMPFRSHHSIRDLLYVVIARSASAATIALGEGIFGSERALVARMNNKVEELGIEALFFDSWGGSRNNRMSARGMAELTRSLINSYPEVLHFTSQTSVLFDDVVYRNTNPLLVGYEGVDGFKTGFTNPAGWCFTGTAVQNGRRIITVTMGSEFGYRFPDTVILLDYGFYNYSAVIANLIRSELVSSNVPQSINSPFVPVMMFDIETSRIFDILDLMIIMNEGQAFRIPSE
jgi:D-alanyl-D-alanine carboxypeptidase (penicillin-binding protein 5/6)